MAYKQKDLEKNAKNRYLRPGALAQLRDSRTAGRYCVEVGKKCVLIDSKKGKFDILPRKKVSVHSTSTVAPSGGTNFQLLVGLTDGIKQQKLPGTPRTPRAVDTDRQSRLESLPMDLLVKIMCHLHHDQLRAPFHVSQRIQKAVLIARRWYFDYTTPDRSRQEILRTKTPFPSEHWPFLCKVDGKAICASNPPTPKAPRHGPRPHRLHLMDMKQIAAVLFQVSTLPSRRTLPLNLPRPAFKSMASNRAISYKDELCHAVAPNKLF